MSRCCVLDGLEKSYNRGKPSEVQVLRGRNPDGATGRGGGAGRAVGCGEIDAAAHRGAAGHGRRGRSAPCRPRHERPRRPGTDRGAARRGRLHLPVPPPAAGVLGAGEHRPAAAGERCAQGTGRGARDGPADARRHRTARAGTVRQPCRAASSSASPSAGRWPMRRSCCWPTNRPATSTPTPPTRCSRR